MFRLATQAAILKIGTTDKGGEIIKKLHSSKDTYLISDSYFIKWNSFDTETRRIKYDDDPIFWQYDGGLYNATIGLAHELQHAFDLLRGVTKQRLSGDLSVEEIYNTEYNAVAFQNYITSVVFNSEKFRCKHVKTGLLWNGNPPKNNFNPENERVLGFNVTGGEKDEKGNLLYL